MNFGYTLLGFGGGQVITEYNIEYLVVGGGGGATDSFAYYASCGSGAGGYLTATGFTIDDATTYTVTVGAGGAGGGGAPRSAGVQGGHSVFSTLTAYGGGYGRQANTTDRLTHGGDPVEIGSGGGGTYPNAAAFNAAQGNAGGNNGGYMGSGGGGAGAAGTASVYGVADGVGTAGGNGTASSITGSSITRAGGGGGGGSSDYGTGSHNNGGSGGGGNGHQTTTGVNGGTNLGGGAGGTGTSSGGSENTQAGANGGSGVVILKIPDASYSGTVTGSPTVDTSSVADYTILIFNASGSYQG